MSMPPWGEEPEPEQQSPLPPPPPGPYGQQQPGPYGQPGANPYGQQQGLPYQPYGGAPSPYGAFTPPKQTNGLAIASLIVSIGSIVLCCGFPGIVGAILGHVARRQIKDDPNQTGEGIALGGIVVGWASFGIALIGIVAWILLVVVGAFAGSTIDDCYTDSDGYYVCE